MRTSKFMSPVLIGQEASKEAMLQIAEYFDTFLNQLREKGYCDSYKISVDPYNDGYELTIEIPTNYEMLEKLHKEGKKQQLKILNRLNLLKLHFEPTTFFNDKWEQEEAMFEYNSLTDYFEIRTGREKVLTENGIINTAVRFKDENIKMLSKYYNIFFS